MATQDFQTRKAPREATSLQESVKAAAVGKPCAIPGLMLLGGALRRVYFPGVGAERVVWRKTYCLTECEAVEEADRFRHAAQKVFSNTDRCITHWTEHLSERARSCVMIALGCNPSGLSAAAAKAAILRATVKSRLITSLTPKEINSLNDALGVVLI